MLFYIYFTAWFILVPVVIAFLRYNNIPNQFKPIAHLLLLGALTELIAYYLIKKQGNNLAVINIFTLLDFGILFYFFYVNNIIQFKSKYTFYIALFLIAICWVLDNLILHHIADKNYIFIILYSLIIAILSIKLFTKIMFLKNNGPISRPIVFISVSLLLYYVFACFINLFNSPLSTNSKQLQIFIWMIMSTILLTKYVLLSFAFLWIKKK